MANSQPQRTFQKSISAALIPLDTASVYAEGKRILRTDARTSVDAKNDPHQDRPPLAFRRSPPSVGHSLRHRQLHRGRLAGRPIRDQWRRDTHAVLPVCLGPRYLALDDALRSPALTPVNVGSAHDSSIRSWRGPSSRVSMRLSRFMLRKRLFLEPRYNTVCSIRRSRETFAGLNETVDLEEAIRRTAAWYATDEDEAG